MSKRLIQWPPRAFDLATPYADDVRDGIADAVQALSAAGKRLFTCALCSADVWLEDVPDLVLCERCRATRQTVRPSRT